MRQIMTSGVVLPSEERARMRAMYASGEYMQSELSEEFGVSRSTVQSIVRGVVRKILPPLHIVHANERTVPTPAGHTPKPALRLSALRGGWFPGVARQRGDCGGRLFLDPPGLNEGRVYCLSGGHEPYRVVAR